MLPFRRFIFCPPLKITNSRENSQKHLLFLFVFLCLEIPFLLVELRFFFPRFETFIFILFSNIRHRKLKLFFSKNKNLSFFLTEDGRGSSGKGSNQGQKLPVSSLTSVTPVRFWIPELLGQLTPALPLFGCGTRKLGCVCGGGRGINWPSKWVVTEVTVFLGGNSNWTQSLKEKMRSEWLMFSGEHFFYRSQWHGQNGS